jgi:hypothetical protein
LFDYERQIFHALERPEYLNKRLPTEEEEQIFKQLEIDAEGRRHEKKVNTKATLENLKQERLRAFIHPQKVKHLAVLKASGLGITEFILRWIAWKCLRNNELKGSQIVIFTGPRLELSISLINRIKGLFKPFNIVFTDKETVCNLNGVRIEAFPSHHADSARGLPNISVIFADEFSFFPDHEVDNIMDIMLRNVPKSNPYLIAVSTPQKPNDAMDRLLKEPFEESPFKRLPLDWTFGAGKIYSQEEIDKIKNSRSFEREFCLKFKGLEGNVFSQLAIDNCQKIEYDPEQMVYGCKISVGLDPSFGSSKYGVVVTRFVNGRIEVLEAEEYDRPEFQQMIDRVWEIKKKYGTLSTLYCDAANPVVWQSLKKMMGENSNDSYVFSRLAFYDKQGSSPSSEMRIIPVPFSINHAKMLQHLKLLIDEGFIAIHPRFEKLITSLRTAVATEYKLDKSGKTTQHRDIFDAFRLAVQLYDKE